MERKIIIPYDALICNQRETKTIFPRRKKNQRVYYNSLEKTEKTN